MHNSAAFSAFAVLRVTPENLSGGRGFRHHRGTPLSPLSHHSHSPFLPGPALAVSERSQASLTFIYSFQRFYLFIFRERGGEGREKERERNISVRLPLTCPSLGTWPPTGDLAHNPGMCPDWEWNQRPFGSQSGAQSTELHQPGLRSLLTVLLRFAQVVSFHSVAERHSTVWIDHDLFILSFLDGRLGWFYLVAVVEGAVTERRSRCPPLQRPVLQRQVLM